MKTIQDELEELDESETEHREVLQDLYFQVTTRAHKYLREVANLKFEGVILTFHKKLDTWRDTPDDRDSDLLQQNLDSLRKQFDKFDQVNLAQLEDSEVEYHQKIQDLFDQVVARSRKYIHEAANFIDNVIIKTHVSTPIQSEPSSSIPVKLPTISLPEFDGSLGGWAPFYDLFLSLIDNIEKLNPVKKLYYLKSAMRGKAADILKNLTTTEDNYQVALDLLKEKFDCPRRTLRTHYANLREYPKLQKDTPILLGQLVDTFRVNLRAMKNLDAPIDNWSVPIFDLILIKIGHKTAYEWELTLQENKMPHYNHLLDNLEKRAKSIHLSEKPDSDTSSKNNFQKESRSFYQKKSALVATNEKRQQCICCKSQFHPLFCCVARNILIAAAN